MNKEEYKKSLRDHYPGEPEDVLELAWHFHCMAKAKKYIRLLMTCNNYADVATKVILEMYVSCDIDSIKALNEKFITALLPFTCMEKTANAHSVTYHVRKMLDDKTVRLERKSNEERIRQDHFFRQGGRNFQTADIIIQVQLTTDNEDFIRQILLFAETNGKLSVTVN